MLRFGIGNLLRKKLAGYLQKVQIACLPASYSIQVAVRPIEYGSRFSTLTADIPAVKSNAFLVQARHSVHMAFPQDAFVGVDFYRDIGPLLERMRALGMWACGHVGMWANLQVWGNQLVALQHMLKDSGVQRVFDHCGRPVPAEGIGQPGFAALLELGATGRAVVKLSGCSKVSAQSWPYADVQPFVDALVDAFTPRQLMWTSDWPFLRAPARIDYGPLVALLQLQLPDPAVQHAVLCDTPMRLFEFNADSI